MGGNNPGVTKDAEVRSPCINVCVLDDEDVCEGCYRSIEEIRDWQAMDNDARRVTLRRSWERARRSGKLL